MYFPKQVEIIEVGPRDGLQNEKQFVPTEQKKVLIDKLIATGIKRIETASFVHPQKVPQMADAAEICAFSKERGIDFLALTPNSKALQRAIEAGVPQIAVFVGATETFNKKNIGRSIEESLQECKTIIEMAKQHLIRVRAYVSMSFSCPYEGQVSFSQMNKVVQRFSEFGVDEIDIGDTNGQANPRIIYERFSALQESYPSTSFVAHFHDTNGFGYANVIAALQAGVTKFDSSIAGLGGCPFSKGATGNIATAQLCKMLEEMRITTGLNLPAIQIASRFAKSLI
ncbi:MAG: hydroxymethylglutaryl-CoA lyase [Lysinibacillus sp.]